MAYSTETRQHYRDAAETQPPITGFFTLASHGEPPAEEELHRDDVAAVHEAAKAEAKQALAYGVQAVIGVPGANGGMQERSTEASQGVTSGAHARKDEGRRKARHADIAYILLMLRLDQLNEEITRLREEIEIFEQDFMVRYGQSYAEYYAAKYLGEDFEHRRSGETREAYSFRVAREIQKKIDKGEIIIDAAEDPLFEQGLKYYRDLERKHREVLEVKKELEPVLKQAELAGESSPEYKMAVEKLKEYTPETLNTLLSDKSGVEGREVIKGVHEKTRSETSISLDFMLAVSAAGQKDENSNRPPDVQGTDPSPSPIIKASNLT